MTAAIKSGIATITGMAIGIYALVNRELSPLFWVLVVALLVDMLLNMKNEQVVVQKLVKAAAATVLPIAVKLLGGESSIHGLHLVVLAVVAAVTLIVLESVIPEVLAAVGRGSSWLGAYLGKRYAPEVAELTAEVDHVIQQRADQWEGQATDQAKG